MRKTKLINNPLKQRCHEDFNQNYDSMGVISAIHFGQNQKRLWTTGKKILQQDRYFNMFNSSSSGKNLDRFKLEDDIRFKLVEDIILQPHKDTYFPKCDNQQQSDENNQYIDQQQEQNKDRRSLTQCAKIRPSRQNQIKSIYLSGTEKQINIPAAQTSYKTFFLSPKQQLNKLDSMRPDFYQSAIPKYMNMQYKSMAHLFEKQNYLFRKPAIIRPREYSADGMFRKNQISTSRKWTGLRKTQNYI